MWVINTSGVTVITDKAEAVKNLSPSEQAERLEIWARDCNARAEALGIETRYALVAD